MKRFITLALAGFIAYNALDLFKMTHPYDVDEVAVVSQYQQIRVTGVNKYDAVIRLSKGGSFFCSGVVIDGTYALTAAHCVSNSLGFLDKELINIHDAVDNPTGVNAVPVALDNLRDTALLKGDFREFMAAPADFDGQSPQGVGNVLVSCGFPSGGKLYCTNLFIQGNANFQIMTKGGPIYKGMSGGPVMSLTTGAVIGVNSAVSGTSVLIAPILGDKQIFQIGQ